MRCFFFNDTGRQLYGALHPAAAELTRSTCVVLAYPWLSDYNACHAAFRKLAALLASAGFPTLRFDYSGMGDSEGAPSERFCHDWTQDIVSASRELSALSRARSLCIVGLGIGGALALAASAMASADQLVLWEPVVSGQRYLDQLDQLDRRQRLARLYRKPADRSESSELLGYPFSQAARREMAGLDMTGMAVPDGMNVSLVAPARWPDLQAVNAKFPGAHHERFSRAQPTLDTNDSSSMLSMEPLRAVVRAVERAEVT